MAHAEFVPVRSLAVYLVIGFSSDMDIQIARIFLAVAVLLTLWSGAYYLLVYLLVFHTSIEFLNSRKAYKAIPGHSGYNSIFIGFVIFIVLNRARSFHASEPIETMLNLVEHGAFALVICLNLLCYLILSGRWAHHLRVLIVVILFNLIGVFNEVFQNSTNGRPLLSLEADATKDIAMNAVGSMTFLLLARRRSDPARSVDVV